LTGTPTNPEYPAPALDPVLATAMDRFVPGHEGEVAVGGRAFLVRIPRDGGDLRLRRWPSGATPDRVAFVHRLLTHLAQALPGIAAKPGETRGTGRWLAIDGALVDVQSWLPGLPSGGRSTPQLPDGHALHRPAALDAAMQRALALRTAELHLQSAPLAAGRDVPMASIDQILRAINLSWSDWRVRLRPAAPNYPPIQRWLRLGEQILPAAQDALRTGQLEGWPRVVGHLNLWPAHVLVDGETIRLLDFGSAAVTTPLLDVAQLVTRFTGWTGEHAESAISDYSEIRTLAPDERRLLPAVAALDLVIESARLLLYGYAGAIPAASRESSAARKGALEMLDSLEAVQPAVVRSTATMVSHARQRQLARIATGKTKSSGPRKPEGTKPRSPRPNKPPNRTG
jgi:hypothetical protein